ncbi:MAG: hypothetical protein KBD47_00780 [Candidatus Pacebacteria bacterium]|jgi:hypothetical protein|nr:hypothetical protein [Candidatus Paceibacterota bacterium]
MKLKTLTVIIIVVLLIGGWFAYKNLSGGSTICWPYCPGMTDQDRDEIKKSVMQTGNTYQNKVHDFEFKYPSEYTQEETKTATVFRDNNKITCEACDDPGKAFYVHVVPSEDYVQSYVDTFYGGTDTGVVFSKTPIKVNGAKEVVTFEDPGELHRETGYIIVRKNQSIIFSTTRAGTGSAEALRDLPQVVTSFRFK